MGKGKKSRPRKQVLSGNGASSNPTSSSSNGRSERRRNKWKKFDEMNLSNSDQEYGAMDKESPLNRLPFEILTEILKCVDTSSLFKCRLVNQKWREISNGILCHRPDTEIELDFYSSGKFEKLIKGKFRKFNEVFQMFKDCKNCPVGGFSFQVRNSKPLEFFDHEEWISFLSQLNSPPLNQNQKIGKKHLSLEFMRFSDMDIDSRSILCEKLRDLLLNKMPRLEKLGLDFYSYGDEGVPEMSLFTSESDRNAFKLPHLQEIYFGNSMFKFPGIVVDLLNAAINLKKMHTQYPYSLGSDSIRLLLSLEKSFIIQSAFIRIDKEFLPWIKNRKNPPPVHQFEELSLYMDMEIMNETDRKDRIACTNFMASLLLESSKQTLRKLNTGPLDFLHSSDLEFPRFKNLLELRMSQGSNLDSSLKFRQIFPAGIRSLNIFPVLHTLRLFGVQDWSRAFPQEDSIPHLPTVKTLYVDDKTLTENILILLISMCPHLKNFHTDKKWDDMLLVVRLIWTHMKQLESLEFPVDANLGKYNTSALDSCFTGISVDDCQHLFGLLEANKRRVYQNNLDLTVKREHPSILDMKNLRKIKINIEAPWCDFKSLEGFDFFKDKLTCVSQEYAFKLMPNLKLCTNVYPEDISYLFG